MPLKVVVKSLVMEAGFRISESFRSVGSVAVTLLIRGSQLWDEKIENFIFIFSLSCASACACASYIEAGRTT